MDQERLKTPERGRGIPEDGRVSEIPPAAQVELRTGAQETGADAAERLRMAAERAARPGREMKDPLLARVEAVLSEGLAKEYAELTESEKQVFRKEGEALAVWLHEAMTKGRVKSHQVLQRIEKWLLILEHHHKNDWVRQHAYICARRTLKEMMHAEIGH